MKTKIAISGIGGVGAYFGGLLAKHYQNDNTIEISFISRGDNLRAIKEKGLTIITHDEQVYIAHPAVITDNPNEVGIVDYLICATKSYDIEANLKELAPIIGEKTTIIPLLNGIDIVKKIKKLYPRNKVLYACVYIASRLTAPGEVASYNDNGKLIFGSGLVPTSKEELKLLDILTAAGIDAQNPIEILKAIWRKFFYISISATITSYYNVTIGETLSKYRKDYYALGRELFMIAGSLGIELEYNAIDNILFKQSRIPSHHTTSMHTDFINKHKTELETLTGIVVDLGNRLNMPIDNYYMMYRKLKNI